MSKKEYDKPLKVDLNDWLQTPGDLEDFLFYPQPEGEMQSQK